MQRCIILLFLAGFYVACLRFEPETTDITEGPGLSLYLLLSGSASAGAGETVVRTKFVYITFRNDNHVRIFQFDNATGGLTEATAAGSPVTTGNQPIGICMHPTQRFLYVVERTGNAVAGYSINAATGALTPLAGSPYASGTQPWDCEVHPNGGFLYAAAFGAGANLRLFSIDPGTGVLTAGIVQATGGNTSQSLVFSNDGSVLFASHSSSPDVTSNTVNPTTGAVTAFGGSPFAAGTFMRQLALTPTENFLYVPSRSDSNVRIYSNAAGALAQTGGSPFGSTGQVQGAAVSPDGRFLYTSQQTANTVAGFSIDGPTGNLTALGTGPNAVAFPQTLYFEPGAGYLFSVSYLPSTIATKPRDSRAQKS
ncbi:MAG: beta-propeller fold lactonase family protein [Leptospirales bacterium]